MKKTKTLFILICLLLALSMCGCSLQNTSSTSNNISLQKHTTQMYALDTIINLTAYGENAQTAFEKSKAEISRLENLFSTTIKTSDISKINSNSGSFVKVSDDVVSIIKYAKQVSATCNGVFDISIYPIVTLWGFTTDSFRVPTQAEIDTQLKKVDYNKIEINESESSIKVAQGMEIDLGGIAKGYISGCIAKIYKQCGVTQGIISLGGNIQTIGTKSGTDKWNVAIENPTTDKSENESYCSTLKVGETSVITSGSYQRYFEQDGKIYHHIIDCSTGHPSESDVKSSTIICNDPTLGDALSTTMFILGTKKAIEYYKQNPKFDFVLLSNDNTFYITKGIKDSFTPADDFKDCKITVIE